MEAPLTDGLPPDERHLLACIERLYAIEDEPDWFAALEIFVDVFNGRSGVLLQRTPHLRVLAEVGAGFAWLDCPLVDSGTGQQGGRLAIHTEQSDKSTLVWLVDGLPDERFTVRIASIREHLRLSTDFACRRAATRKLSGRLSAPGPERIAQVEASLATLNSRARACVLLAARGYTNAQISDYLQAAPGTVARSLQEAYRHLDVAGRSDLDVAALLTQPKPESPWQAR